MLKRVINFLTQPYTNVIYCVAYQFQWRDNATFAQKLKTGINDAWRTSPHEYLYGSDR